MPSCEVDLRAVDADDPDARGLVGAYFAELQSRLGGFDPPSKEQLRTAATRGVILVAYDANTPVACGSLRLLDEKTAEVKRMFVAPEARGRGFGRIVLRALEDRARSLKCTRIVLDTAAPLEEAARMYLREGYLEVRRYNDNPYAARWFEKGLT